ncbi:MAG: pilus assembly protein [Pirellulales bacterium]
MTPSLLLRRRKSGRSRRGAHTVEMAFCLPVLIVVIFAIIEFARANQIRQTVKQAAYEAARVGISANGTAATTTTKANQILSALGITGATVTVTPTTITSATTSVSVFVSVPPAANGWFMKYFTAGQNISTTVTLESENASLTYMGNGS